MNTVDFRGLTALDAAGMARLHADCFETSWPALDMAVHVERDICFGAGLPLQSFIIVRKSGWDAEVLTIATAPGRRGQGLASALLAQVRESLIADNIETLYLEVAEDNKAAMSVYRRFGFDAIGRRPAYYRRKAGRVAAITFSLSLAAGSAAR